MSTSGAGATAAAASAAAAQAALATASATYEPVTVVTGTGIDASGATNITTAVQALITSAGVGGVVHFPPGTYQVDNLTALDKQRFTGPGKLIRPNGSINPVVKGTGLTAFRMDSLTIDGNRAGATATSNAAVSFTACSGVSVTDCRFQNMPTSNPAVQLYACSDSIVADNVMINVGYGVVVGQALADTTTCRNVVVSDNVIDTCDLNGVFLTENLASSAGSVTGRVLDCAITGNTIRNAGDAGIESGSGCVRTNVSGNNVTCNGTTSLTGILVRDNVGTTVTGNTVSGSGSGGQDGIAVVGLNGSSTDYVISGNTVTGASRYGIHCQGNRFTVAGNLAYLNGSDGINIESADQFACTGNTSRANGEHGFCFGIFGTSSATNGTVTGNASIDNARTVANRDGFATNYNSKNLAFTGNLATDTRASGKTQRYGINLASGTNMIAADNDVAGNNSSGVSFNAGVPVQITNNYGHNPAGAQAAPALPGSGLPLTNPYPYPVTVYINQPGGGTVTGVDINGTSTGLVGTCSVRLGVGQSVTPRYGGTAPTWTWFAD